MRQFFALLFYSGINKGGELMLTGIITALCVMFVLIAIIIAFTMYRFGRLPGDGDDYMVCLLLDDSHCNVGSYLPSCCIQ